jgi:hypothetical protein
MQISMAELEVALSRHVTQQAEPSAHEGQDDWRQSIIFLHCESYGLSFILQAAQPEMLASVLRE